MKLKTTSVRFRLFFFLSSFIVSCFCGYGQQMDLLIYNTTNTPALTTNNFTAIGVGKGGQIWAGTLREGLFKYDDTNWVKSGALSNHAINDIKTDRDGGIWIAQSGSTGAQAINGGLDYFPNETDSYTHYGGTAGIQNSPLPSRNARSVFIDTTRYNEPTVLPVVWSAHMSQVTAGAASSGGIGRGLYPTDPTFQIIRTGIDQTNGLGAVQSLGGNDKVIWAFAPTNFGRSQILEYDAATNNLIGTYDNTVAPNALSSNFQAKAIYIDKSNRKWIGMSSGGIVIFDGSTWHTINFPGLFQSLTFVNNNAITSDDNGNVYIGTSNGLIVYNGGPLDELSSYKQYTTTDGLTSSNIKSVAYDKNQNRILLATDNGIALWSLESLNVKLLNPYPSMVKNDGYLSTDLKNLDTTKIVKGVATDGVSKLILYFKSGEAFTFKISSFPNDSSNGTLSYIDNEAKKFDSVRVFPKDKDSMIAVIYNAPDGYGSKYDLAGGREVIIQIDGASDASKHSVAKVRLVTPPVVLVHGMWSNPDVWNTGRDSATLAFEPYLHNSGFLNIQKADYENANFRTFDPQNTESIFGRAAVYKAIRNGIDQYERDGILTAQVDVVGHSLGGLMTRSFSQWETINFSKRNYKQGYIHKLITLGTPHSGSPFGPELYYNYNEVRFGPIVNLGSTRVLLFPKVLALNGKPIGSCHRDFNPNDTAILHLKPTYETKINKVHAVIGINEQSLLDKGYLALSLLCRIAFNKTYSAVFNNDPETDLIVKVKSQLGGLARNSQDVSIFNNTGHSGPATVTETNNPLVHRKVKSLLHTNTNESFADYFPSPQIGSGRGNNRSQIALRPNRHDSSTGNEYIKLTESSRNIVIQQSTSEIEIAFDTFGGAKITNALCMIQDIGWYSFSESAPYSIKVSVPKDQRPVGKLNVLVLAKDTSGIILGDTSYIMFNPSGSFVKMELDTTQIVLDSITKQFPLNPHAVYISNTDTVKYDIRDTSSGITYVSLSKKVKINSEGVVTANSAGIDTVLVSYAGQTIKIPILIEASALENEQDTKITFSISDKKFSDSTFPIFANASSGEEVSFTLLNGAVELVNDIVTIKGTGTVSIKATSSSNAYFDAADTTVTFNITKANQTITFDSIPNISNTDTTIVLRASTTSSLPITFRVVSGPATIKGDTLQITGSGTIVVNAIQVGNESYVADSVTRTFIVDDVLPITYISFDGEIKNNKVDLYWTTASEQNNKQFEVEYSNDGVNFETLGVVAGKGNSNTPTTYTYLTRHYSNGKNYYRLKQVDFDGNFKYSAIVQITVAEQKQLITIYPNPASKNISLSIKQNIPGTLRFQIQDVGGRSLFTKEISGSGGIKSIGLPSLPKDVYIVSVRNHKGEDLLHNKLIIE